jgi:hypothetical protein
VRIASLLPLYVNFLSNNPRVVYLMDGFKAQTIVRRTTKVNVERISFVLSWLEHLEQVDEDRLPVGHDVFDPRPLHRSVSKNNNLSIIVYLFSFSCILLFFSWISFLIHFRVYLCWACVLYDEGKPGGTFRYVDMDGRSCTCL